MLDWLKKLLGTSKKNAPPKVPAQAEEYMAAMQPHMGHPFVQHHFRQIIWLASGDPGSTPSEFFALEFRAASRASLIWCAGPDAWCVGKYVPLASSEAEITTAPSGLTPAYWGDSARLPSLENAIAFLEAATPAPYLYGGKKPNESTSRIESRTDGANDP